MRLVFKIIRYSNERCYVEGPVSSMFCCASATEAIDPLRPGFQFVEHVQWKHGKNKWTAIRLDVMVTYPLRKISMAWTASPRADRPPSTRRPLPALCDHSVCVPSLKPSTGQCIS